MITSTVDTDRRNSNRRSGMSKTELIEWLEEIRAEYEKNGQLNEMWAIERVIRKVMEE